MTSVAVESAEQWCDDLFWHRRMFQAARTQWDGREAIDIVTRHTGGQLEFHSLADLEQLSVAAREILAVVELIERSLGASARDAAGLLGSWSQVGDEIGYDWRQLRAMAIRAARTPAFTPHPDVRVAVRGIPQSNPLTEAWEIKQLRSLWLAAAQMVEDTLIDLVDELAGTDEDWETLAYAVWESDAGALACRLESHRAARGLPGDPRRRITQVF